MKTQLDHLEPKTQTVPYLCLPMYDSRPARLSGSKQPTFVGWPVSSGYPAPTDKTPQATFFSFEFWKHHLSAYCPGPCQLTECFSNIRTVSCRQKHKESEAPCSNLRILLREVCCFVSSTRGWGVLKTRPLVALGSFSELSTFTMSLAPPAPPSPIFLTDTETL